jgi:prepilin-type N-terminal cleavage/methylation domain-containing protein
MQTVRRETTRGEATQSGFSLLEMIVAIAMFTIVVGAIYGLLEVGRSDAFNTSERTETMQNSRIALNMIGRDAVNAGVGYWKSGARTPDGTLQRLLFLGGGEVDGQYDLLTPIVPGNDVRPITVDGATVATDAVTFVYQDDAFNNGASVQVTNVNATTNNITVSDNTPCQNGNLFVYVIDDGTHRALGSLTAITGATGLSFAPGDPLQLNNTGAASSFQQFNNTASLRRVTWVTYFVKPNHVLVRRVYGDTASLVGEGVQNNGVGGVVPVASGSGVGFVEMPLAFGVENFQIKYVLDDGATVDDIGPSVDANGNAVSASDNRQRVRIVKVSMKLRGDQVDPKTKQPIQVSLEGSFYTANMPIKEPPAS